MEYRKVNSQFLEQVLMYPDQWERNGLIPGRGILLMGNNGVGKSHFMAEFAQVNSKICWGHPKMPSDCQIEDGSADSIRRAYHQHGPELLQQFSHHDFYLDDLGSEVGGLVNLFGTTVDPIYELLMMRYRVRDQFKTYITTNHTMEQIRERYGYRIADRLHEMCNILILEGVSRRLWTANKL